MFTDPNPTSRIGNRYIASILIPQSTLIFLANAWNKECFFAIVDERCQLRRLYNVMFHTGSSTAVATRLPSVDNNCKVLYNLPNSSCIDTQACCYGSIDDAYLHIFIALKCMKELNLQLALPITMVVIHRRITDQRSWGYCFATMNHHKFAGHVMFKHLPFDQLWVWVAKRDRNTSLWLQAHAKRDSERWCSFPRQV